MKMTNPDQFTLQAIGYLRNEVINKFGVPQQTDFSSNLTGTIELLPHQNFEQAVEDLESFSHIWLVSWFHKNQTWKPKVLPPRGKAQKRGVFSTRSPHRPNQIGLTAVELLKVEKNKIYIGASDLIDGTPILDIKPYLNYADSIPTANNGWIDDIHEELEESLYEITYSKLAKEQLAWLKQQNVDFKERAEQVLKIDPTPHKTRRIKSIGENYNISCGGWRMIYTISERDIYILQVLSGYPLDSLKKYKSEGIPDLDEHLYFHKHSFWSKHVT